MIYQKKKIANLMILENESIEMPTANTNKWREVITRKIIYLIFEKKFNEKWIITLSVYQTQQVYY